MKNLSRRDFLKFLGLAPVLSKKTLETLSKEDINLEERLILSSSEDWLRSFEVSERTALITYKITPKILGLDLGWAGGGNIRIYFNSDNKEYEGIAISSLYRIIRIVMIPLPIFERRLIFFASKGHKNNENIFIPETTVRIDNDWDKDRLRHIRIRYDYKKGKALFEDGKFLTHYDMVNNVIRYNHEITLQRDIDIKSNGYPRDFISEYFSLSKREEKLKKDKFITLQIVSKVNNKPGMYPVNIRLEEPDKEYPNLNLREHPQVYAMWVDLSKLFGREMPLFIKGFSDKHLEPLIGNIFNFIPGITLTVTRETYRMPGILTSAR